MIPIIHKKDFEIKSFVIGFQEYKNTWTPVKSEKFETRMESGIKKGKFAVSIIGANQSVVGHLLKDKTERFSKIIFYFLRGVYVIDVTFVLLLKQLIRKMVKAESTMCTGIYRTVKFVEISIKELKTHV